MGRKSHSLSPGFGVGLGDCCICVPPVRTSSSRANQRLAMATAISMCFMQQRVILRAYIGSNIPGRGCDCVGRAVVAPRNRALRSRLWRVHEHISWGSSVTQGSLLPFPSLPSCDAKLFQTITTSKHPLIHIMSSDQDQESITSAENPSIAAQSGTDDSTRKNENDAGSAHEETLRSSTPEETLQEHAPSVLSTKRVSGSRVCPSMEEYH